MSKQTRSFIFVLFPERKKLFFPCSKKSQVGWKVEEELLSICMSRNCHRDQEEEDFG